jgi:triphosphatase
MGRKVDLMDDATAEKMVGEREHLAATASRELKAVDQEFEIKFETDATGLAKALESPYLSVDVPDRPRRSLSAVYFDTAGGDLRKNGITLRLRKAQGRCIMTVKWADALAAGPFARREIEVKVPTMQPELSLLGPEIAAQIELVLGGRALLSQFETQIKRRLRRLQVGRAQVEVAFDEGVIVAGNRRIVISEIELELKAGDKAALYDLAGRIGEHLPVRLGVRSKAERGFLLAAGEGLEPVRAASLPLASSATLDDVAGVVLAATLDHFVANWRALDERRVPEAVHQMRVALRRMRVALALFDRIMPCADFVAFRAEARRIASELSRARDWDVFRDLVVEGPIAHHRETANFDSLLAAIEVQRQAGYDSAENVMLTASTTKFVLGMYAFLAHHRWRGTLPGSDLSRLTEPAIVFAGETLERLHRRALKRGRNLKNLAPEQRHELRIALKHIRYVAEFFAPLFEVQSEVRAYSRTVALLQDGLGAFNDTVVATKTLHALHCEGVEGAKAIGIVLGWYGRGAVLAERDIRRGWKNFRHAKRFWAKA